MTERHELQIAEGVSLPPEAVTETFAILARRGSGKTYTSAVIVEEMVGAGLPVVVIDPVGVWWGLRSNAEGDGPGIPILILGGEHGDVPITPAAGETIADLVINEDLSVVIDLSEFSGAEQIRFMTAFGERLYLRNRRPLHVVLDEADAFAPQSPLPDQRRMLGAMEKLVRRGRARGIGMTLITQRPAVLNKSLLTQIEVLIALRTPGPQDRKAIDAWISAHASEDQRQEVLESLASLQVGEAWVWSPSWLNILRRVHIRRRRTFDSSATPKIGETRREPRVLAEVDLAGLRERIAGLVEESEPSTPSAKSSGEPEELKRRISELERQLADRPAPTVQRVEVPVLSDEQIATMREIAESIRVQAEAAGAAASSVLLALDRLEVPSPEPAKPISLETSPAEPRRVKTSEPAAGPIHLRDGERRMLAALARLRPRPLSRVQVGSLAGFSPSGGTFGTYLSVLKRAGFVTESAGALTITYAGIEELGSACPRALQTTVDIQALWRGILRSGERKMLDVLIRAHPNRISRKELARQAGFAADGGTFGAYLSVLRRNGLATVVGQWVSAGDALFAVHAGSAREASR